MKKITELAPGLHYVGANDRTTQRFEALWSLPYGVSYNSYLLVDEKVALIDSIEAGFADIYFDHIAGVLGDRPVDYLIVNHMEPDHSGSITRLRERYPDLKIVGNAKTLDMIGGYYGIRDNCLEVKEGDTLSLGGRTLRFHLTPMIHWPETMMTYCVELKALFSGDAFGTFGALNGGIVDSQLCLEGFWDEMRRYYACIVSKYGKPVQMALRKLAGVDIEWICSTHGPVWHDRVADVVALYDKMSRHEGEYGVVIAYGSMYGNTEQLAERIARELAGAGIRPVVVHNLSHADESVVLRDIFRYDTLVVGSPTYNGELFPPVEQLLRRLESRCIPHRRFACFGSYTWAGAAVKRIAAFAERMKWEPVCEAIEMKQGYKGDCCETVERFAARLAERIAEER